MPLHDSDLVKAVSRTQIAVAVEPAHIAFHSLLLLVKADKLSGYNEWVTQTAVALSPDQRQTHQVILEGLHAALAPGSSWPSFPAYIDHLAAMPPERLIDRLFASYNQLPARSGQERPFDQEEALASPQAYLDYLYQRFEPHYVNVSIETDAYHLLQNPDQMQHQVVSHLRHMWHTYLADEWDRVAPLLHASADAFNELDFTDQTPQEIARTILDRDLPKQWEWMLNKAVEQEIARIIFVPSPHLGPYLGGIKGKTTLWLLFGARMPTGVTSHPDLSRAELLVRLNALADDTRLTILQTIRQEGELCSQDLIQQLHLSQSAASRHLKQLAATGYLTERRREIAKCYQLNTDRIADTLQALSYFLLGE